MSLSANLLVHVNHISYSLASDQGILSIARERWVREHRPHWPHHTLPFRTMKEPSGSMVGHLPGDTIWEHRALLQHKVISQSNNHNIVMTSATEKIHAARKWKEETWMVPGAVILRNTLNSFFFPHEWILINPPPKENSSLSFTTVTWPCQETETRN